MKRLKVVNEYEYSNKGVSVNGILEEDSIGLLSEFEKTLIKSDKKPKTLEFSMNSLGLEFSKASSIHHVFCPMYVQKGVLILDVRELHRKKILSEYLRVRLLEALIDFREDMNVLDCELLWR